MEKSQVQIIMNGIQNLINMYVLGCFVIPFHPLLWRADNIRCSKPCKWSAQCRITSEIVRLSCTFHISQIQAVYGNLKTEYI